MTEAKRSSPQAPSSDEKHAVHPLDVRLIQLEHKDGAAGNVASTRTKSSRKRKLPEMDAETFAMRFGFESTDIFPDPHTISSGEAMALQMSDLAESGRATISVERTEDGSLNYRCSECGHVYAQRGHANRHLISHNNPKPFQCEICDKRVGSKYALALHQRIHEGTMPYDCPECGATFRSLTNLNVHRRSHQAEMPYTCEQCGRGFTTEFNLQRHHTRAHELRPAWRVCGKGCGVTFATVDTCMKHEAHCNGNPTDSILSISALTGNTQRIAHKIIIRESRL
jgi:DNA-directed RNA polymerase subunit RPC12/RpoP